MHQGHVVGYTFREARGGGENMAKNEKPEHLIERLVRKHISFYDPVSADYIDAVRNVNIWASVSTALHGHPEYDWRGLPQFFGFQCLQRYVG